jgi:hypothetical protein
MTPKPVHIQISPPGPGLPGGAISSAFYIVEGGKLTLTDNGSRPLYDFEGKSCTRMLAAGDDPHQQAALLLRGFRSKVRGDRVSGFDRPLRYPKMGKI